METKKLTAKQKAKKQAMEEEQRLKEEAEE